MRKYKIKNLIFNDIVIKYNKNIFLIIIKFDEK